MLILVLVFVLAIKKIFKLKKEHEKFKTEVENLKILLKLTEDDFDEYFNKYWELKNKEEETWRISGLFIFFHILL